MAKSKVQFQKGYSLFDFFKDYGTEAQCENALLAWEGANKSPNIKMRLCKYLNLIN